MTGPGSSRRRHPAPRPSSVPTKSSYSREFPTSKRRGELAELAFTLKAASLGFSVSKPYGDSDRYDFILDARDETSFCHPERGFSFAPARKGEPQSKDPVSVFRKTGSGGNPRQRRVRTSRKLTHRSASTSKQLSFRRAGTAEKLSFRRATVARAEEPASPPPKNSLHRVQVKCSTQLLNGLYRVNSHRRTNGRAVPYLAHEIDFLAAWIIPEDTWYIIPLAAFGSVTSLLFRRKRDPKPGLYDAYREAWHLLRPE
jgi:hypothetical protein